MSSIISKIIFVNMSFHKLFFKFSLVFHVHFPSINDKSSIFWNSLSGTLFNYFMSLKVFFAITRIDNLEESLIFSDEVFRGNSLKSTNSMMCFVFLGRQEKWIHFFYFFCWHMTYRGKLPREFRVIRVDSLFSTAHSPPHCCVVLLDLRMTE